MKTIAIAFLIFSSQAVAANVIDLSVVTPDDIQQKCRQEKRDLFYENQFIDCLARSRR